MAEPPNISSILAALAAQRPGGTPTQGAYQAPPPAQQSALPPGFPGALPSATTPTNLGGFQIPQPTNSGSLDLSSIRPTNSGTVSIADAIAKAKEIAAGKTAQYDPRANTSRDADPRLGGRPYRHSRSRSRSPPPVRRDNFRDNYNPYRDERRDDRRGPAGREYPRDRSFSPGIRDPRGQFSPPPGRSFGGARAETADEGMETIQIDSTLVGLIIGRQGENLRRVEGETGARVQFVTGPDVTGPTRNCKVTGPRTARAEAKEEIYRIIEMNGRATGAAPVPGPRASSGPMPGATSHQPALREGEDSTQIMVPDRTVGLIIGRGGETIRDLQERSGCHVNIVGEQKSVNGLRPVNLIGTVQAAQKAKDLIMEIVDSDTKSLANQGAPQRDGPRGGDYGGYGGGGGGGGGGGAGGFGGGSRINDSIFVPSEAVGMIIGKGGETIKDMQNTTGCKINVSQPSGPGETQREIGLVGSRDSIEQAKRAIEEKVDVVKRGGRFPARDSDPYSSDRYSNQQSQQQQAQQPSYGQPASQSQQGPGPQGADAAAGADPYAAYGGYQNYVAMWYAAMAQQQQAQGGAGAGPSPGPGPGGQGEPRPPGTA
ncbi:MAG: hypothetical protein M1817_002606 [Caeruleum heppii]|nr:MAG: hypothetical protein M1817_002606 [Caeruleum heppii]